MAIRGIDHINIGTHRLEETRAFFRDVLGLTEGWRPDFPFGGAWLYAGDGAVVHLVDLTDAKRPSSEAALDSARGNGIVGSSCTSAMVAAIRSVRMFRGEPFAAGRRIVFMSNRPLPIRTASG